MTNSLQSYSPIATTSRQINWRYIDQLNYVQKKDGLHAANKITDKHVCFENHKMKVSLAAQTLSRSVSVALRTMRDLGYSQFRDCEATADFIEVIHFVIILTVFSIGFLFQTGFFSI